MKKLLYFFFFLCLPLIVFSQTFTVDITPEKDNSMFSEGNNLSNGAGSNLFSGRTEGRSGTDLRRALIKFNVSGIPANAQIDSVILRMPVMKAANNTTATHNFSLHKAPPSLTHCDVHQYDLRHPADHLP